MDGSVLEAGRIGSLAGRGLGTTNHRGAMGSLVRDCDVLRMYVWRLHCRDWCGIGQEPRSLSNDTRCLDGVSLPREFSDSPCLIERETL